MTSAEVKASRPSRRGISFRGRSLTALGGIAAQCSQALASFVLQILAARLLGLEGLGRFAALYAIIILATALCSGFVGDSLTVLDRTAEDVRGGLQAWLVTIALVSGAACAVVSWAVGFVSVGAAVAFGTATSLFLVEDTLRRLLMATLDFWRIVVVDLSGLVASVVTLATLWVTADDVTLGHLLVALAIGQAAATIVAVGLIPRHERRLASFRRAAMRPVASYGAWRAVQQAVRPSLLASVRLVCLLVVSTAAVGALEAARIYMAPAMLAVGGLSSFLFASYADRSDATLADLLRTADRSVVTLLVGIVVFGIAAVALIPLLGPLLTDGRYDLSVTAVVGWAVYSGSVAAVTPYAQLAAVRGRQPPVLATRVADSVLSLVLVYLVVVVSDSTRWAPFALAIGSLLGGLAIRQVLLRRQIRHAAAVIDPMLVEAT